MKIVELKSRNATVEALRDGAKVYLISEDEKGCGGYNELMLNSHKEVEMANVCGNMLLSDYPFDEENDVKVIALINA